MYKNFNLTESEKEQILNMHKNMGYKRPINEQGEMTGVPTSSAPPIPKPDLKPTSQKPASKPTSPLSNVNSEILSNDLIGKTVNFYLDKENKNFFATAKIKNIVKETMFIKIDLDFVGAGLANYYYDCETKRFTNPKMEAEMYFYSTFFANELSKRYCSTSAGGVDVPKADFQTP